MRINPGINDKYRTVCAGKELLDLSCIGTLMDDNSIAAVDEEDTSGSKIPGDDIREGVMEELIRVGRPRRGGDLEDQGSTGARGDSPPPNLKYRGSMIHVGC